MKADYEINIGLEIHAELKTKSKIFCGCKNGFGDAPNTNVCPVCLGCPGTLPMINKQAVILAIKAGIALGCNISPIITFDRKHYFYPDLPKAYQISQNEKPICIGGGIKLDSGKIVRFNHIHLEEDAGKLIHDTLTDQTYIDYNRGGVPLIEHVTEVDISSADEAVEFLSKLRQTLIFSEVADCKMEQGGMRCDVNISVKKKNDPWFGTKTEIKNLNSFKSVQKAIEFESNRQIEVIENGGKILQETRRWDDEKGITYSMRTKEGSADYRYMPEPDSLTLLLSVNDVEEIKNNLPMSPAKRIQKYISEYCLPEYDAKILTSEKFISDYFDNCVKIYNNPKVLSNWIMTELLKLLKELNTGNSNNIISEEYLCIILQLLESKKITRTVAKDLFDKVVNTKQNPLEIVKQENLITTISNKEIYAIIDNFVAEKSNLKDQYAVQPDKITNFIVGAVMKATSGKADAEVVKKYISKIFE